MSQIINQDGEDLLMAASKWLNIPVLWTLDLDMIWESDDPSNNNTMTEEEIEAWMREKGFDSIKIHLYPMYPSDGQHFQDQYRLTGLFKDITGYVNDWYDPSDQHSGKHGSYYLDDIEVWMGDE